MTPVEIAIPLIQRFEGFRLKAYLDGGGVPTIGYGSTGPDIHMGLVWTTQQATERLHKDVSKFAAGVASLVKVKLTDGRLAALISFTYNVGLEAFKKSTMLKLINEQKYYAAGLQFLRWNKDNGKVIPGLTNRRVAEKALWDVSE